MRRRLRKKRRLGEFTEYGFSLQFTISPSHSTVDRNVLIDEFIDEIERLGLNFGGGGSDEWYGFIALTGRGSATKEHRSAIVAWCNAHPDIQNPIAGELVDAWHT